MQALTKVRMTKKFWALSRSPSAFQFCLPTLCVEVFLWTNSFCINVMTTMCLLNRVYFVNEIRLLSLFSLSGEKVFLCRCVTVQQVCERFIRRCAGSLQLGAMFASVENNNVEWRGHDSVACVVKAVRALLKCHGVHDVNGRCPMFRKCVQTPTAFYSNRGVSS